MATKVGSAVLGLVILGAGFYAVSHFSTPDRWKTMSRADCVKNRTSNAKMRIALEGSWGGGAPATISYSVTDQPLVGPFDHPAPNWATPVYVRVCDLIILHVTPTEGEGETKCSVHRFLRSGAGTNSRNPNGGPVQCVQWYESLD